MGDLASLLERVEKAAEHEAVLLCDAAALLLPPNDWRLRISQLTSAGAPLDAALALVERCLPGWRWMVRRVEPSERPMFAAYVEAVDGEHFWRSGPAPALALIAALLRALIATE